MDNSLTWITSSSRWSSHPSFLYIWRMDTGILYLKMSSAALFIALKIICMKIPHWTQAQTTWENVQALTYVTVHISTYIHVFLVNYINNNSIISHFHIFLVLCLVSCLFHKFTFIQECELVFASMHTYASYVFTGSTFQTRYMIESSGLEST